MIKRMESGMAPEKEKRGLTAGALVAALVLCFVSAVYASGIKSAEVAARKRELPIYSVERNDNRIAISFDAAWGSDKTKKILDILDEFGVKTTFFMVDIWTQRYPDLAREIAARGHDIGNHSSTHPKMSTLSREKIKAELETMSDNAEKIIGLFEGNMQSKAPFIIQISKGARKYTSTIMLEGLIRSADQMYPDAIFAVHLDHGDEETCYDCINSGFYSSVMIDASSKSFDENVATTKRVVDAAHAKGLVVEAELGQLGGVEEHVTVSEADAKLTDPDSVKEFVEKTGVDSLAVAIGTSHGAFKFSGSQSLHFDVLAEIQKRVPGFPLVMHGSSSVPQEEVARINAAGGNLASAKGVDDNQFLQAAKLGVTKINIDTDGRLVWTRVHREYFRDHPEAFDFRPVGKIFMSEYANFIAAKNVKLGSAGHLDEVRELVKKA